MSRQTAFPSIIIDSIEARNIQSGSGRTLDLEEGLPEKVPTERIMSFLEQIPLFGSDMVDHILVYNLEIAAINSTAAEQKARTFVRAKNPFEADMVDPSPAEKMMDIGVLDAGRDAYRVSVEVEK